MLEDGEDHGHDHHHHDHDHDDPDHDHHHHDKLENETDEEYEIRFKEAKEKFVKKREACQELKSKGSFKNLFRSKGFIWLSNKPEHFYEWA